MNLVTYYNALKFRFNRFPSHLVLFVTARCNARCRHCFYWQNIAGANAGDELTLAEIEAISKKMGHVKLLSITGGEPGLRDDIPEIASVFCRNNQTHNIVLHTNGFFSDRISESAARIAADHPAVELNVSVSLDGLEETHDMIRGLPGLFGKALDTLRLLTAAKQRFSNLNVTVNCCFNAYNRESIAELSEYLFTSFAIDGFSVSLVRGDSRENGAKEVAIDNYLQQVASLNRKNVISRYYNNYPLASFRRALDFMAPAVVAETLKQGKMLYPCMAGRSTIVITEKGEVKPCEMLPASFGNVRDFNYDIAAMLFSPSGVALKKSIRDARCCCTWECAIMNNIIFNWSAYPRLIKTWIALEFEKKFGNS